MLNYRLATVNEKHWGLKPVYRCSKPHTFSTFSNRIATFCNKLCVLAQIVKTQQQQNKTNKIIKNLATDGN